MNNYLDLYKQMVEAYFAPTLFMFDLMSELHFKSVILPMVEAQ